MAKKRIHCPECGHTHTVTFTGLPTLRAGVHARRITGNQFEYSMSAPQEMIESERFTTITDDLLLIGAMGLASGSLVAATLTPLAPDHFLQIVAIGASAGLTLAWGWLCAEHNQRLKCVLPWFAAHRDTWAAARSAPTDQGVTLTVDHRYRDGHTETGRTTQFFGVLPVDVERFNEYARAVLRGDSLAIKHWTGKGNLFSRSEYDRLLAQLQHAETVVNVPGKGNQLTGGGKRAIYRHLKSFVMVSPLPSRSV